jgi:hypothetical protein
MIKVSAPASLFINLLYFQLRVEIGTFTTETQSAQRTHRELKVFSVRPLCPLCLCGERLLPDIHLQTALIVKF